MVCLCFSPFSGEIQESEQSFLAQRIVMEPTRRTAAVLSLPAFYPCSSDKQNYKNDYKFLSKKLRGRD